MQNTTQLRQYFFDDPILALPVAHDPLVARLLEDAGFRAVCVGGYATTAALLGLPDVGLVDRSQVADAATRTVDAVSVPVFADADTGYGGPASVVHTVRQFERAGVAGLFIEDQTSPKRCGHMTGKDVIPAADMRAKIRAAADARHDDDLVLMARTDVLAVHGTDAALERMHSYIAAGADVAFVEAPPTKQALRFIAQQLPAPAMANMILGGTTPLCSEQELSDFGYAAVAYPTVATYAITAALRRTFSDLHASGDVAAITDTSSWTSTPSTHSSVCPPHSISTSDTSTLHVLRTREQVRCCVPVFGTALRIVQRSRSREQVKKGSSRARRGRPTLDALASAHSS